MKKKFRVELTPRAETDIRGQVATIAKDKPGAAEKWLRPLKRKVASIVAFPLRFEVIPEEIPSEWEFRHFIFGNYRIIYRIDGERVLILRVFHAARLLDERALE